MNNTNMLNTHEYIKRLEAKGMPSNQAEIIVELIYQSVDNLVTRQQLQHVEDILRSEINNIKEQMATKAELQHVEDILRAEINNIRTEITSIKDQMATKADMNAMKVGILQWMIPFIFSVLAMLGGLVYKIIFIG